MAEPVPDRMGWEKGKVSKAKRRLGSRVGSGHPRSRCQDSISSIRDLVKESREGSGSQDRAFILP